MNSRRRAGANETFGRSHPHLARLLGDPDARAHAETELGRRHWLRTLFGGHLATVSVFAVVTFVVARLVRGPAVAVWDAVSSGTAAALVIAVLGVVVVVWLARRWMDPVRRARRTRIR